MYCRCSILLVHHALYTDDKQASSLVPTRTSVAIAGRCSQTLPTPILIIS
jgi:hypothetical protein